MSQTQIDHYQIKNEIIKDEKIAPDADIQQSKILNLENDLADRVVKTGDTMTGYLTLHDDPILPLHSVPKRYVDSLITASASASDALPAGTIVPFSGSDSNVPNGWFLCDGSSLDRTTYAELFAALGTTYGSDSGTTFKVPDLRGRAVVGLDNMGGASANVVTAFQADILGGISGAEKHTLSVSEMPGHNHDGLGTLVFNQVSNLQANGVIGNTSADTNGKTGSTGGNQPHNNMPPYMALNYIVKAYNGTIPENQKYAPGYIKGLNLQKINDTTITVKSGRCLSDDDTEIIILPDTNLDFASGGLNGVDDSILSSDKIYYIFAIKHSSTGQSGIIASLDKNNPILPAGFIFKRWIGCINIDVTSKVSAFIQRGNYNKRKFYYDSPLLIHNDTYNSGSSNKVFNLDLTTVVPNVQPDIIINAKVREDGSGSGNGTRDFEISPDGSNFKMRGWVGFRHTSTFDSDVGADSIYGEIPIITPNITFTVIGGGSNSVSMISFIYLNGFEYEV